MKASESGSESTSGATSASGPQDKKDQKDQAPKTEAEYLAQQVADAQAAMSKAWGDLKHSLGNGVDVRQWTGRYPWIATGTALAAGLAAGYLLTPRDRDEAAEMWEKLKEKLHRSKEEPNTVYVEAANGKAAQAPHQGSSSLLGTLAREAIKSLVPLVTSMLGAAVGGGEGAQHHQQQETPEPPKE